MAEQTKPDMSTVWASVGAVIAPSNAKIGTGWTAEIPPHQWENFVQNRQDQALLYLMQHGIPEWDATTEYFANKSFAQRNGKLYLAIANSVGADPETVPASWDTFPRVATTTERGVVELATTTEATAGTDTERAVTPAGAASLISSRKGRITFTANGTWTIPVGVNEIWISGVAGGGGGGAGAGYVADRQYPGGGGGAGQAVLMQKYAVVPGHLLTVTVPFGGAGGLGQPAGQAGGGGQVGGNATVYNSTIGSTILTLVGGQGGTGGAGGGAGAGGAGYPAGGAGTTMYGAASILGLSGAGASSVFGGGGGAVTAASFQNLGKEAGGYGAGGSGGGGLTANFSGPNGGPGSQGIIFIEW